MDYFRVSRFNGLSGPIYGVEYTQNDGRSWITTSTHTTFVNADREMRSYVATHAGCALWDGSLAQKISAAQERGGLEADPDFSSMDLREQYRILKTAKELLAHLNTEEDFPYMDAYYDGTSGLQKAMAYVDGKIQREDLSKE